jgi:hypothetical protein
MHIIVPTLFAVFHFRSQYGITSIWTFIRKICKVVSWEFDCRYTCLWSIITSSGSSKLTFKRLPTRRIWSERWFRWCIFTKLNSDSLTRCSAISHSICVLPLSMECRIGAVERLYQVGSLSHSFYLSKVCCVFEADKTFFIDFLVSNRVIISF